MTRRAAVHPVTKEHMAQVTDALRRISDVQPILNQLDQLGEDTADRRQVLAYHDQRLRKIQQTFGEGR